MPHFPTREELLQLVREDLHDSLLDLEDAEHEAARLRVRCEELAEQVRELEAEK